MRESEGEQRQSSETSGWLIGLSCSRYAWNKRIACDDFKPRMLIDARSSECWDSRHSAGDYITDSRQRKGFLWSGSPFIVRFATMRSHPAVFKICEALFGFRLLARAALLL